MIKLQQEWNKPSVEQKNYIISLFHKWFPGKIINSDDTWFDLKTVTLGQIIDNNKNILICADKNLINKKSAELDDDH